MNAVPHSRTRVPGKIDSKAKGAFLPSDIGDLKYWYDVSFETGLNDNDLVSLWSNRGENEDATSSGGDRPTYKTNIVNGYPVYRFSGAHRMYTSTQKNSTATTIFSVLSRAGTGNSDYIMGDASTYCWLQYGDNWYYVNGAAVSVAFAQDSFKLKCMIYDGVHCEMYTNGALSANPSYAGYPIWKTIVGGAGYSFSGDVADVFVYHSALTATDRNKVETYLNNKYALW